MNLYRLEDVAKHNGQNGAKVWVVIQKTVYDLTDYVKEHPGGDELILEFAGKDGTKGFNDYGHSSDAKSYMKKYKIGELAEHNCKKSKKTNGINKEFEETATKKRRSILMKLCLCS